MQVTKSPQSIGLSLGVAEVGCVVITGSRNGNGCVAIINSPVHQIPRKCGTVIGRHHHIIKLIGRVEAVHRTRHHIIRHHIILQHQGAIADIGIRTAVLKQVVPCPVEYASCIGRYGNNARIHRIRRFVVEKIAAARRQDEQQPGRKSRYIFY